jgi:biopolymer transport protein ExbB
MPQRSAPEEPRHATSNRSHVQTVNVFRNRPALASFSIIAILLAGFLTHSPAAVAQEPVIELAAPNGETVADAAAPVAARPDAAERKAAIPATPADIIREMRYFLVPFVIASIIAVWFAIERIVVLRHGRVIPRPFVERFLQHLEQRKLEADQALELCEENGSPVAAVFAHGVRKWGKPSVEVEQAIIDGGERQVSQLRKHLRVLNGVATVSPLMGLLGTVIGMIQAFNDIAGGAAMGRAEQLAGGIALALLTTAVGLTIAIPSLITYMYLTGRVDALVIEMDALAQNVVHLISAEALTEKPSPPRPRGGRKAAQSEATESQGVA